MNRRILDLAIPNIISNITIPLLGIVDLAMMGRLGNEVFIGAIALGGMIFNFIYWGFSFLRMGTSGFTAQAFGTENKKEIISILSRALLVGLLGSVLLIILQYPIEKLSFWVINGSSEVEYFAGSYFYIRIWAAPATISLYAFTGWFIGMQNARTPMVIAIVVNVLNLLFNLLFVFVFDMKSDGVALGTVLAQYSGLLLAVYFLKKHYSHYLKFWEKKAMLEVESMKTFFRVNKDIFIRTLALIFTLSFFTSKSAEVNDTILAINTILFQFFIFFSYFVDGFSNAGEALTGRFIGAKDKQNLNKSIRLTFYWATGVSLFFVMLNSLAGKLVLQLMTNNQEIIDGSLPYMPWIIIVPIASFVAFIWDGVYIGATVSNHLRNSILIALAVFLGVYYLTTDKLGNHGLWLAFICFLAVRGIYLSLFAGRAVYHRVGG
ncbi:MAG: MATE family efflux transporter [Bacteroidetes bacterium 4484_276]|nr:MAG: MATE family efflux transporter [Bacteroidetes bacterium 4484_276]